MEGTIKKMDTSYFKVPRIHKKKKKKKMDTAHRFFFLVGWVNFCLLLMTLTNKKFLLWQYVLLYCKFLASQQGW